MSEPKTSIPKFGSFKPRLVQTTPQVEEEHPTTKDLKRSRKESSRNDSKNRRHRHRSRSRDLEKRPKPTNPSTLPEVPLPLPFKDELAQDFVVDRKGDVNNLIYGSIHRYSVPPFRRSGAGGVIGVPMAVRIDRNYGDEKGIVLSNRMNVKLKSREKYVFSKLEKQKPRLVKIRTQLIDELTVNHEADFIRIQSREKKRKRGDSSSELSETDYRSIHGKAKVGDQPMDEDLQYITESDGSGSENGYAMRPDTLTREKTMELSRQVEQRSHDIDAWLALIEHQDTLLRAGDDRKRITSAEIQSTAEIKIHMYEKALDNVTSLSDREKLLLGLMREGSKIWEIKTQSERWEKISKDNIDSLVLWKSYMSFKQTTFSTFRYEEVRELYLQRLSLLSETIRSGATARDMSLHSQWLYVLLRFTIFVRESAYSELAIAIWQSILEFNLFAPDFNAPHSNKVDLFKEFWESEVPRIGEAGALGWRHFVANPESSEPPGPAIDEEAECPLDGKHLFRDWAKGERSRQEASHLPARTMDEVVEDDPFRVILASDIEPLLMPLDLHSENLRASLLNAFLLFSCLPPIGNLGHPPSEDWLSDQFIEADNFKHQFVSSKQENLPAVHDLTESCAVNISSIFETPTSKLIHSPDSMFCRSWFGSMGPWSKRFLGNNGPVSYNFIRTTLRQLTKACLNEGLSEYYLAFEWQNEPDTIKKVAKGLLKQHPSSLVLYNAYGLIERARGHNEVSNAVFNAALEMSRSVPEEIKKNDIILLRSWVWAALEDLDTGIAIRRLLSMPETTVVEDSELSPAALLKAKQHLLSNRDHFLTSGEISYAVIYAECLAILEYLSSTSVNETQSSNQGNISSAIESYRSFSETLTNRKLVSTAPHELFLQSAARLLYHHARIGPFRPALLREHLAYTINLFPQNTIFLSLYAFNESRLRVENRVRSILISTVLTPQHDTLTSRIFAIHNEMQHGNIHSVRAAFENALSSPASRSSVRLWEEYILFCLKTPQFAPHIKDMWYRALRACPWAKELYILGFERIESLVEFSELKGTWRVMGEKELRVHVDLEDKFDESGQSMEAVEVNERGRVKRIGLK